MNLPSYIRTGGSGPGPSSMGPVSGINRGSVGRGGAGAMGGPMRILDGFSEKTQAVTATVRHRCAESPDQDLSVRHGHIVFDTAIDRRRPLEDAVAERELVSLEMLNYRLRRGFETYTPDERGLRRIRSKFSMVGVVEGELERTKPDRYAVPIKFTSVNVWGSGRCCDYWGIADGDFPPMCSPGHTLFLRFELCTDASLNVGVHRHAETAELQVPGNPPKRRRVLGDDGVGAPPPREPPAHQLFWQLVPRQALGSVCDFGLSEVAAPLPAPALARADIVTPRTYYLLTIPVGIVRVPASASGERGKHASTATKSFVFPRSPAESAGAAAVVPMMSVYVVDERY